MSVEIAVQYISMIIAVGVLFIKRQGMKKYVPVALFASLYANIWCYIAIYFDLWHYHAKLFPVAEDISIPVNLVVVPIMAMVWVRYCPARLGEQLWWAFIATTGLIVVEFAIERYTNLLAYHSGYQLYHSYLLWFISWFIWLGFHLWLNDGEREIESLFAD